MYYLSRYKMYLYFCNNLVWVISSDKNYCIIFNFTVYTLVSATLDAQCIMPSHDCNKNHLCCSVILGCCPPLNGICYTEICLVWLYDSMTTHIHFLNTNIKVVVLYNMSPNQALSTKNMVRCSRLTHNHVVH